MKKFNIGIAALKFLMALVVVNLHFGVSLPGQRLAVPVFMFCSFFYAGCRFDLRKRIVRILIPFWFWNIVGVAVLHFTLQWPMSFSRVVAQFCFGGGILWDFGLWPCC